MKNLVIVLIIVAAVLFWFARRYLIVATVNGQPVSRFELNERMNAQFGQSTLDSLVNERLIMGASRQEGIFITKEEIDTRVKEIQDRLKQNNVSFADALSAQGLNEQLFRRQLEIQLSIEKMFDKKATVSATEIDEYLKNYPEMTSQSTDAAKLKTDSENILKQQKINGLFEEWFANIKKDAKISSNI